MNFEGFSSYFETFEKEINLDKVLLLLKNNQNVLKLELSFDYLHIIAFGAKNFRSKNDFILIASLKLRFICEEYLNKLIVDTTINHNFNLTKKGQKL